MLHIGVGASKGDSSFNGSDSPRSGSPGGSSVEKKVKRNKTGTMSDANRSIDKKRRRDRAFLSGYRVRETPVSAASDGGYDDEEYGSESQEAASSASDYLGKIEET